MRINIFFKGGRGGGPFEKNIDLLLKFHLNRADQGILEGGGGNFPQKEGQSPILGEICIGI